MSIEDENSKPMQLNTLESNLLPDISSFMDDDQKEESVSFGYYKKQNGGHNPQFSVSNIQDFNNSNVDKTIVNLFPEATVDQMPSFDLVERQQILFKPITPDTVWNNKRETFIYIRCQMLTTFYYCLIAYSQFSNPHLIENDPRYELKFLYPGNKINDEDPFSLLPTFHLNNITNKMLEPFITALNIISRDEKYLSIRNKNLKLRTRSNIIFYSLLILCVCLTIGLGVYLGVIMNGISIVGWVLIGVYVFSFFVLLYFMISYKKKYKNSHFLLIEQSISYRIKNHSNIEKFISEWNRKLFFPNKVSMWAPISLDYVMFNLCQEHDIQLKHHSIDEIKNRKY